jgi:hypothetical protein
MASILIVDDEEGLQSSLVKAFAMEGYQAAGAGSGLEALDLLQQTSFDVLLTDLMMPDIDGINLMERARLRCPATVVIPDRRGHGGIGRAGAQGGRLRLHPQTLHPGGDLPRRRARPGAAAPATGKCPSRGDQSAAPGDR